MPHIQQTWKWTAVPTGVLHFHVCWREGRFVAGLWHHRHGPAPEDLPNKLMKTSNMSLQPTLGGLAVVGVLTILGHQIIKA